VAHWRLASRHDPAPPAQFVPIPISAYVIEEPAGLTLFDTGCHPEAMTGRWPLSFQDFYPWSGGPDCHLPQRLTQLGLTPGDFATVVLSHLHSDHAGCVEFFRHARLIVHADELAAAWEGRGGAYLPGDIEPWRQAELNWQPLGRDAGDLTLSETTTVLNLGSGHAPGMLALLVRLPRAGPIILASDACYCAANYAPGFLRPGVVYDTLGYDRTIRHLSATAQALRAQVWFGHDLAQFATLRHAPAGWYE
jgi:glyoxylase-like metal-dependent hydrolase (beta-lactamase superfamily II)